MYIAANVPITEVGRISVVIRVDVALRRNTRITMITNTIESSR
jgi:hypothetical protein